MSGFFHVAFVVPEIEAAMKELGDLFDVGWREVHTVTLDVGTSAEDRREQDCIVTFSAGPVPAIELMQSIPGTSFVAEDEPVLHHIGRWVDDLSAESARYERAGCPLLLTGLDDAGRPYRFAMHETSFGVKVELVDVKIPKRYTEDLKPSR